MGFGLAKSKVPYGGPQGFAARCSELSGVYSRWRELWRSAFGATLAADQLDMLKELVSIMISYARDAYS